jgi:hypothetical protein
MPTWELAYEIRLSEFPSWHFLISQLARWRGLAGSWLVRAEQLVSA